MTTLTWILLAVVVVVEVADRLVDYRLRYYQRQAERLRLEGERLEGEWLI
jgi:hypothetical protein